MNPTLKSLTLGLSTGVTVFAIVIPSIHVLAELAVYAGMELGPWDSPIEIFIFLISSAFIGAFPWGLWIVLTDARRLGIFNDDREVVEYLLAAMGPFIALVILACTHLQPFYAQYRWYLTPILLVCAVALLFWRWRRLWGFSAGSGFRGFLDDAIPVECNS